MSGVEIASLALKIDSTDADKAAASLDKLTAAGARTEASTTALTAAQKALVAAQQSGSSITSKMIQDAGGFAAAEKILADATKAATAATLEGAAASKAAGIAGQAASALQVAGHAKVAVSSMQVRESLVLLREAAVGNLTRLAGSSTILAGSFGLMTGEALAAAAGVAVLVAPLALIAVAMQKGSEQAAAFNNAIAVTGNYAGLTADRFDDMAKRISTSSGLGIGKAKADIEQLAASGKFTADTIELMVSSAERYSEFTGQSTDKILADYESMKGGVVKWAVQHEESYHDLTLAQIDYIAGLERQGDHEKAEAQLMQDIHDNIYSKAAPAYGYLQQVMHDTANVASNMWDALLGIGRPKTLDQQIIDQAGKVQQAAASLNNLTAHPMTGQADAPIVLADRRKALSDAVVQMHGLQMQKQGADATADRMSAAAQANDDAIRKKYDNGAPKLPKTKAAPKDTTDQRTATVDQAEAAAEAALLQATLGLVKDVQARADIAKQVLDAQLAEKDAALDRQIAQIKGDKGLDAATKAALAARLQNIKGIDAVTVAAQKQAIDDTAADQVAKNKLDISNTQLDGQVQLLSLQDSLAKTATERRDIELKLLDLADQRATAEAEGVLASRTATDTQKQIAQIQLDTLAATRNARIDQVKQSTQGPLEQYLTSLPNTAAQINEALQKVQVDGLKGLEDGLTDVIGGTKKLGDAFHDIADQIIADLARIVIEKSIVQPLANALGLSSSVGVTGQAAGSTSSLGGLSSVASGLGSILGIGGAASSAGAAVAAGSAFSGAAVGVGGLTSASSVLAAGGAATGGLGGLLGGAGALLASNPVGWAIAGIGAVGAIFGAFSSGADKAKKEAERAAAAQQALADAQKAAAAAAQKEADTVAKYRDLQIQLMTAIGDTAGAQAAQRSDELAALDPSNRAIQQALYNAQDANTAFDTATQAVSDAQSALSSAYNDAVSGINDTKTSLLSLIDTLQQFRDGIDTSDQSALGLVAQTAVARAQFGSTLDIATSGTSAASTTAQGQFVTVAQQLLASSKQSDATELDYARDVAAVKRGTIQLQDFASQQVSVADQQLAALSAQVAGLGILNNSVLSVADAVNNLAAAQGSLAAAQALKDTAAAAAQPFTSAAAPSDWSVGGALWNQQAAAGASNSFVASQSESQIVADWNAKPGDFVQEYNNFKVAGLTLSALDAYWHLTPGMGLAYASKNGLPAFAKGGVATGPTVGLFGEAGPEAIMPLSRGADGKLGVRSGSGDNSALLSKLEQMRAELQAANIAIAKSDSKMARLMERWDKNGLFVRGEDPALPLPVSVIA